MLDEIVANKRIELEETKRQTPLAVLKRRLSERKPRRFKSALSGPQIRLIAEVKKASPSRGLLCPDFDPVRLAREYARAGAAAISVLTESRYFMGSIKYLAAIREAVRLPLLRKDFIVDPYQVYEAAASGADAVLLIVAILDKPNLADLIDLSHACNLDCLVEVHSEAEIGTALGCGAQIIGINNRDLKTLAVDTATVRRLRPLVPQDRIVIAESGIKDRSDIAELAKLRVNAALIGEALVTAADIPGRIRELGFDTY